MLRLCVLFKTFTRLGSARVTLRGKQGSFLCVSPGSSLVYIVTASNTATITSAVTAARARSSSHNDARSMVDIRGDGTCAKGYSELEAYEPPDGFTVRHADNSTGWVLLEPPLSHPASPES